MLKQIRLRNNLIHWHGSRKKLFLLRLQGDFLVDR